MVIDWVEVWTKVFKEEIERQAKRTTDAIGWYNHNLEWLDHFVGYVAKDTGMTKETKDSLTGACEKAFDEVWNTLRTRLKVVEWKVAP